MSIQQNNLTAIADAIREKDGTTAPIPAGDFPARIRAIESSALPDNVRTITVTSSDPEMGTVSGGGVASDGMVVQVEAKPNSDCYFKEWVENGEVINEMQKYLFEIDQNRNLTATFSEWLHKAGKDWIEASVPGNAIGGNIAFGDGMFVVCYRNSVTLLSTNGINWEEIETFDTYFSTTDREIVYGNGMFLITEGGGSTIGYSSDGVNWKTARHNLGNGVEGTVYCGGKFFTFGGKYGDYSLNLSTDGITWTTIIPNGNEKITSCDVNRIAYGNDIYIALTYPNRMYSTDGYNWYNCNILPDAAAVITFCNNLFVAADKNTNKVFHSIDGLNWRGGASLPVKDYWFNIAYGEGLFVIVGSKHIVFSENLDDWMVGEVPDGIWKDITFGKGKFVAGGYRDTSDGSYKSKIIYSANEK